MTHQMLASAYHKFRPYLHNTGWIVVEKLLVMALGFVATVFVARYLGPADFGILAYATSLAALFGIAGHLGLQGLVVRELVDEVFGHQGRLDAVERCAAEQRDHEVADGADESERRRDHQSVGRPQPEPVSSGESVHHQLLVRQRNALGQTGGA